MREEACEQALRVWWCRFLSYQLFRRLLQIVVYVIWECGTAQGRVLASFLWTRKRVWRLSLCSSSDDDPVMTGFSHLLKGSPVALPKGEISRPAVNLRLG